MTVTNAAATLDPTVEVQGIAFKTPAANLGSVTVNGVAVLEPAVASVTSKFDVVLI